MSNFSNGASKGEGRGVGNTRPEAGIINNAGSPEARTVGVPLDAINWTTGFWAERYKLTRKVTVRKLWEALADPETGHVLDNFRIAAGYKQGDHQGREWQDAWLYKWIEAASCIFRTTGDAWLESRLDESIPFIAAAQEEDGYVGTQTTIPGKKRFETPSDHEVYCMGHLITAAVTHRRMTGKESFLEIAIRCADYLHSVLGNSVDPAFAHNPSAIMGLVELYRETGESKYLDCAGEIVNKRGHNPRQGPGDPGAYILGSDQIQDRVPLREETEVVGHNVFFTYLFAGATDVYLETGDAALKEVLERLWTDLVARKMNVNGGVSPMGSGLSPRGDCVAEAVGPAYFLPNADAYNETCGQVGNLMWNQRMLIADPQARFADMVEWEIYNGILPGMSLAGDTWWYRNPLRRHAHDVPVGHNNMAEREFPGRDRICCPTNVLRTLAQFQHYVYTVDNEGVWIHQYGASKAQLPVNGGETLGLEQKTDYPWDGQVTIMVGNAPDATIALRVRIPGWAKNPVLKINGQRVDKKIQPGTYAELERVWNSGDRIELYLPMPGRLIVAHPKVEQCRNQVAVARGPILYCLEGCDLPGEVRMDQVYIPGDMEFQPESMEGMPVGITALRANLLRQPDAAWNGQLYQTMAPYPLETVSTRLVPYFAWANRTGRAMTVWLPVCCDSRHE